MMRSIEKGHDERTCTLLFPQSIKSPIAQLKPSIRPRLTRIIYASTPIPPTVELGDFASALEGIEERGHAVSLDAVMVEVVGNSILPSAHSSRMCTVLDKQDGDHLARGTHEDALNKRR